MTRKASVRLERCCRPDLTSAASSRFSVCLESVKQAFKFRCRADAVMLMATHLSQGSEQ